MNAASQQDDHRDQSPLLPLRDPRGHKGTFGTVAVIGGSCDGVTRMIGAPVLAARAALRSGAGLVRLAMPEPILAFGLVMLPSATGLALPTDPEGGVSAHQAAELLDEVIPKCEALVVGPGLGLSRGARTLVLRAVQQESVPVVIDADALNTLADTPELYRDFRAPAVLTPHPGEFARLARAFRVPAEPDSPASRSSAAEQLAQRLGCIVVLKGAGTVVSDGYRSWTCQAGHHCLATAGTGDVLAGLLGGLIAQFVRLQGQRSKPVFDHDSARQEESRSAHPRVPLALTLFEAAQLAVHAHAVAGERWAAAHDAAAGLLAPELADLLPSVLRPQERPLRPTDPA